MSTRTSFDMMTLRDSSALNRVSHALLISQHRPKEMREREIAMNKTMRVLTMAGLGVMAGLAIGAGPAQASDSSAATATKTATAQAPKTTQAKQFPRRDQVVGYYRSLRACELAGRIGERFGQWEDYDCDFIRVGFRRGAWALEVERDWGWGRPGGFRPGMHHGPWGPGGIHHGPGGFHPGGFNPGGFRPQR
jgi:hypothetical protein